MSARVALSEMTDAEIDALLPDVVRRASYRFWAPVAVARRAGLLLDELKVRRVLDAGSGPGKFCIVAAARAPNISFVGVEHRPHLVAIARSLVSKLGVRNVSFAVGDATCVLWSDFDAFFVFNSFAENAFRARDHLDDTVELSRHRRVADILRVERWLSALPVGTVLLTYEGLGAPIPGAYECLHTEALEGSWLRVWRRASAARPNRYWLEDGEELRAMTIEAVGAHLFQMI